MIYLIGIYIEFYNEWSAILKFYIANAFDI